VGSTQINHGWRPTEPFTLICAVRISLVEVRYAHFEHKEEQFATKSDQNFRRVHDGEAEWLKAAVC